MGPWEKFKKPWEKKYAPIEVPSHEEIMAQEFKPSKAESFGVGGLQGMLFEMGDEALGRLSALKEIATTDKKLSDYDNLVKQEVQTAREAFGRAKKENPGSYVAGDLTGTIATSAVPALNAAKGAKMARYGKAAFQGGARGYGAAETDDEKLSNMAIGAPAAMLGQSVGEGVAKVAGYGIQGAKGVGTKIKEALSTKANQRAWKATGAMLGDLRGLFHQNRIQKGGETLLDHGVVKAGDTVQKIAKKAEKLTEHYGQRIGKVQDALDEVFDPLVPAEGGVIFFNPARAARRLQDELVKPNTGTKMEEALGPVQNEITRLTNYGNRPLKFAEAKKIIKKIDEFVDHTKEQSPQLELLKRARGIINSEMEDSVEKTMLVTGNKALFPQWKKLKAIYGTMKEAKEIAQDQLLRIEKNRIVSPSDYGMGAAGLLYGAMTSNDNNKLANALTWGVGGAGANKLARTYGPALAASTYKKASGLVPKGLLDFGGKAIGGAAQRGGAARSTGILASSLSSDSKKQIKRN